MTIKFIRKKNGKVIAITNIKVPQKKTRFNDIVEGCKKSDIKPRFKGQTKEEACLNIAGAIEVKRRKVKQLS